MSNSSFNRPGAIDLSQLAARAKQNTGSPGRGAGGRPASSAAGAAGGSYVIELDDQTFEAEVIAKSSQYPIVIEFYSPRVGAGGDQLSADLAALAAEAGGKYLLARLNVDASQIPQAIGVQAVPTVIAAVGGQLAPLFQGALPKDQAKAYIDELLKAAMANGIVGRAEPVGGQVGPTDEEPADADQPDPRFAAADEAIERGDFVAAEAEFDTLLVLDPNDAEAKAGKAQAGLLARSSALDPAQTLTAADAPGATIEQKLAAADVELSSGQADQAFERLLSVVRSSAGADRETARVRLLELFETLGNADPRVQKARRALMSALF